MYEFEGSYVPWVDCADRLIHPGPPSHTHLPKQITERKLKKLEKEYQAYLEQQAQMEDPVMRLEVGVLTRAMQ